jgi:hypothetical protein
VRSPNGKKSVRAKRIEVPTDPDGQEVRHEVHVGNKTFVEEVHGWEAEISWAPDSSAFAVTEVEGRGGIGCQGYVFFIQENGLRRLDFSPAIEKADGLSKGCEIKLDPNTAVVTWLKSDRLLMAAETVPVSICKCSCPFTAYEIHVPDLTIVAQYSQRETKKEVLESSRL